MGVELSGNLNAEIRGLLRRADNLLPGIAEEVTKYLHEQTERRYAAQVDPDGKSWEPLSEKYRNSKRKRESAGANRILVLDDIMRRSYKSVFTKSLYQFGTNDKKAILHQEGLGRLPVREHLGLNSDNVMRIGEIAMNYLENSNV